MADACAQDSITCIGRHAVLSWRCEHQQICTERAPANSRVPTAGSRAFRLIHTPAARLGAGQAGGKVLVQARAAEQVAAGVQLVRVRHDAPASWWG